MPPGRRRTVMDVLAIARSQQPEVTRVIAGSAEQPRRRRRGVLAAAAPYDGGESRNNKVDAHHSAQTHPLHSGTSWGSSRRCCLARMSGVSSAEASGDGAGCRSSWAASEEPRVRRRYTHHLPRAAEQLAMVCQVTDAAAALPRGARSEGGGLGVGPQYCEPI